MPRASSRSTLERHWELLDLLPRQPPGLTAAELAERLARAGHPVSRRTVERDLRALRGQFDLGHTPPRDEPAGRWWARSGQRRDLLRLQTTEALALALAGDILAKLVPAGLLGSVEALVERGRAKLASLPDTTPARQADLFRFVHAGPPLLPPRIIPQVASTLLRALVEGHTVTVSYAAFGKTSKEIVLHPLTLMLRGPAAYLVARPEGLDEERLYALHRVESAKLRDEPRQPPPGYDADRFLAKGGLQFGNGNVIRLRARLSMELAMRLEETPLAPGQLVQRDSRGWLVTADVIDSWELHAWIFSQAEAITVLAPRSLRTAIQTRLELAAGAYGGG